MADMNEDEAPLPRRVHRQIGHLPVSRSSSDTQRQLEEYDELCGPVTIRKVEDD